jgi:hypothetical protein
MTWEYQIDIPMTSNATWDWLLFVTFRNLINARLKINELHLTVDGKTDAFYCGALVCSNLCFRTTYEINVKQAVNRKGKCIII